MKKIAILFISSAILLGCSKKTDSNLPEPSKPSSPQDSFRKISVSEIENEVRQTSENLKGYFGSARFKIHSLRKSLEDLSFPNTEVETATAIESLKRAGDEASRIGYSALEIGASSGDSFKELEDSEKICKYGYLRIYEDSKFTYAVVKGDSNSCQEALNKSKSMIEKIQVQAQFLNAEKSQVASMGFKIRASIDNDLLQPIRIATVMGNRPERVFLGFPWDIGASLDIIKESNSKLSEILFVQNSQDMTVSINLADPKKVNDQIGSTLGLFQLLRKQKVSKETEEILLGYEKYLQALQDAAGKLNQ